MHSSSPHHSHLLLAIGQDGNNLVVLHLAFSKIHQQLARLVLVHPLEVLDAVVAVVHVEVGEMPALPLSIAKLQVSIEMTRPLSAAYGAAGPGRRRHARRSSTLCRGLRVWVAWWRNAVEQRKLFEQLVFNVRACAILLELLKGHRECASLRLVILHNKQF